MREPDPPRNPSPLRLRFRLFRPVLQRVEQERNGVDLVVRVDLGRARDAAAVAMLAASVLMPNLIQAEAPPR